MVLVLIHPGYRLQIPLKMIIQESAVVNLIPGSLFFAFEATPDHMVRQVFLKAKSVGMSLGVNMVSQWGANNCIKKSKLRWFFGVNWDFCLIPLDSLLITY